MGYQMGSGEWADTKPVYLLESATKTATYTGPWVEIGDRGTLRLDLVVTDASGTTPTLDVDVETASDSSGSNSNGLGSFSQKTAAGSQHLLFHGCDRFARIVATIAGTGPSFTFSVSGEAV